MGLERGNVMKIIVSDSVRSAWNAACKAALAEFGSWDQTVNAIVLARCHNKLCGIGGSSADAKLKGSGKSMTDEQLAIYHQLNYLASNSSANKQIAEDTRKKSGKVSSSVAELTKLG